MSISETDKIDIVATRPDSTVVRLVIADHLPWDDLDAHGRLLQDKINTYLDFVASGQLGRMREPKVPASPEIWIVLAAQHRPTVPASEFLGRVEEFLRGLGMKFALECSVDAANGHVGLTH
jgi:hypothetical protein